MERTLLDALNPLGEAQLNLLLDQLPAGRWATDAELRVTAFGGNRFPGHKEEIGRRLGLTLAEFFHIDGPLHEPIAAHRRALAGKPARCDIALYGREYRVWTEPLRDRNGAVIGCLGLGLDVTVERGREAARRASEARWRAIFDGAGTGVVLAELDRRIVACNPAYERLTGYDEEELRGRRFPVATHPDDARKDMALFRELVAGRRDRYQVEKRYVRKDNTIVWGILHASRIQGELGTRDRVVGVIVDITERKKLEMTLRGALSHFRSAAAGLGAGLALIGAGDQSSLTADQLASGTPVLPAITGRERLLLLLLDQGKSDKEMAHALSLADSTVRKQLSALYSKLEVGSRAEAASWARRRGLFGDGQS